MEYCRYFVTTSSNHTTIGVSYAGDSNYLPSGSGSYTITVAGTDFNFIPQASTTSVSRGQTVAMGLTIDGQAGYSGTVNFTSSSCAGLPGESSCTFSPTSVAGTGGTTLFIATTAPHTIAGNRTPATRTRGVWPAILSLSLGGMVFLRAPKQRCWRRKAFLGILLLGAAIALPGCGGGGGGGGGGNLDPGTPPGNYAITVTATTGSITHTAQFKLTVQ